MESLPAKTNKRTTTNMIGSNKCERNYIKFTSSRLVQVSPFVAGQTKSNCNQSLILARVKLPNGPTVLLRRLQVNFCAEKFQGVCRFITPEVNPIELSSIGILYCVIHTTSPFFSSHFYLYLLPYVASLYMYFGMYTQFNQLSTILRLFIIYVGAFPHWL